MAANQARIRWLNIAGETFFANACNNSGLTTSPPGQDENGWDFFVEMPQNRIPTIHLDAQPAPIKFLCQVKSSDDISDLKRPVTVSNMEHLSRSVLPTFVLMLDFRDGRIPVSAHLCHINNARIGVTLKKIRELNRDGKTDFHKHNIIVTADPIEAVNLEDENWVAKSVSKHTGYDAAKYSAGKADTLKMIGFNENRRIMRFETYLTESETVDAFLGLRDLEVVDVAVMSNRFDIELPEDFSATGKLTIEASPIGDCHVVISSKAAQEKSRFPISVVTAPLPGLSKENFKIKAKWPFTQFIISLGNADVEIKIDQDAIFKLSELIHAVQFFHICSFSDAKITFYHKGGQFAQMSINDAIKSDPAYKGMEKDLQMLRAFLDISGHRDDVSMCLRNLYQQTEDLGWIRALMGGRSVKLSGARARSDNSVHPPGKGVFARPVGFDFDDRTFVAFCEWDAIISVEKLKATAKINKGSVWGATFISSSDTEPALKLHREFERYCQESIDGYLIFQGLSFLEPSSKAPAAKSSEEPSALDRTNSGEPAP